MYCCEDCTVSVNTQADILCSCTYLPKLKPNMELWTLWYVNTRPPPTPTTSSGFAFHQYMKGFIHSNNICCIGT